MRRMILAAAAAPLLLGAPAWAKGDDDEDGHRVTEAPLPPAGAGLLGLVLLGGAGGVTLLARRRHDGQHG